MKKIVSILENIILGFILLAVLQAFFEDFAVVQGWSLSIRKLIVFFGFLFDLIFSIEFLVRSIVMAKQKKFTRYFLFERGWIDFLSSLPLLFFVSGPAVLLSAKSGNRILNLLKIIKAIRVAKILRLIRILKIFGKIQNAQSKMAQRHIAEISTTGVVAIILVLIFSYSLNMLSVDSLKNNYVHQYETLLSNTVRFANEYDFQTKNFVETVLVKNPGILYFGMYGKNFYSSLKKNGYPEHFSKSEYKKINFYPINVILDLRSFAKKQSQINLAFFFAIVVMILFYLFIYTRIFAQSVSDVVYVMLRGMREEDYNYNVKLSPIFEEEEIFQLAKFYNEKYLPMKNKELLLSKKKKTNSKLSLDDFMKF